VGLLGGQLRVTVVCLLEFDLCEAVAGAVQPPRAVPAVVFEGRDLDVGLAFHGPRGGDDFELVRLDRVATRPSTTAQAEGADPGAASRSETAIAAYRRRLPRRTRAILRGPAPDWQKEDIRLPGCRLQDLQSESGPPEKTHPPCRIAEASHRGSRAGSPLLGTTERRFSLRPHTGGAQSTQVCAPRSATPGGMHPRHNGGSGAASEPAVSYGALVELRLTWC
jgi:hypothetical protein